MAWQQQFIGEIHCVNAQRQFFFLSRIRENDKNLQNPTPHIDFFLNIAMFLEQNLKMSYFPPGEADSARTL